MDSNKKVRYVTRDKCKTCKHSCKVRVLPSLKSVKIYCKKWEEK